MSVCVSGGETQNWIFQKLRMSVWVGSSNPEDGFRFIQLYRDPRAWTFFFFFLEGFKFIHLLFPLVPTPRVLGVCWSLSQQSLSEGSVAPWKGRQLIPRQEQPAPSFPSQQVHFHHQPSSGKHAWVILINEVDVNLLKQQELHHWAELHGKRKWKMIITATRIGTETAPTSLCELIVTWFRK